MALKLGDVYYRIQANTAGLQAATRQIQALGKAIEQTQRKAATLNKTLGATMVPSMHAVARTANQSANTVSSSANRQMRSLTALKQRYDKLADSVLASGAPVKTIEKASVALAQLEHDMSRGNMTANQFAKRQEAVASSLARASRQVSQFRAQQDALARQTRALSMGREQAADLKNQAALFANGDPRLIAQADAAFQRYHKTLSSGVLTTRQLADANARFHSEIGNVRRQLARARVVGNGFFADFVDGIKSVGTAFAAFLVFQGLQNIITGFFRDLDELTSLNARLGLTASTVGEVNDKFVALFEVARRTRQGLIEVATLYNRVALSARNLGISEEQTIKIVESFGASLILSGASASEARAATLQFSQALASGRLQGDEFRSVLENNRVFAALLAKELAGGSIQALFKMREAGELTSESVAQVAEKINDDLLKAIDKMPFTMGQASALMNNELLKIIRNMDAGVGITRGFSNAIRFLADNMNHIVTAIGTVVGLIFGRLVVALGAAIFSVRGLSLALKLLGATWVGRTFTIIAGAVAAVITKLSSLTLEQTKVGGNMIYVGAIVMAIWDEIKNRIKAAVEQLNNFLMPSEEARLSTAERLTKALAGFEAKLVKLQETRKQMTDKTSIGLVEAEIASTKNEIEALQGRIRFLRGEKVDGGSANPEDSTTVRILKAFAKWLGIADEKLEEFNRKIREQLTGGPFDTGAAGEKPFELDKNLHKFRDGLHDLVIESELAKEKMDLLFSGGAIADALALDDLAKVRKMLAGLADKDVPDVVKALELMGAKGLEGVDTVPELEKWAQGLEGVRRSAESLADMYIKATTGAGGLNELLQIQLDLDKHLITTQDARITGLALVNRLYVDLEDNVQRLAWMSEQEQAAWMARQKAIAAARKEGVAHNSELVESIARGFEAQARVQERFQRELDLANTTRESIVSGFQELYSKLREGENLWDAFSNAAVSALDRILQKMLEIRIIRPFIDAIPFGGGAPSTTGGGTVSPAEQLAAGVIPLARGGAFVGGVRHFANGGIVRQRTPFMFAGGVGIMGEAGAEAIMPLRRLPSGDLGVMASGAGGGTMIQIIDQRGQNAPAIEQEETTGPDGRTMIRLLIRGEMEDMMNRGTFDKTLRYNYGIRRKST